MEKIEFHTQVLMTSKPNLQKKKNPLFYPWGIYVLSLDKKNKL